mmetsp:Transcript_13383/g.24744  ORF Transcript_13383/g.24744 Transcript_13383/m.24744 type:complete len:135 (-) Transcript_13383:92-496(-)
MPGMGNGGNKVLIDITLTDPRNASNVGRSSVERQAAIKRKVDEKNRKYRELCHAIGYSFLAAAIEVFGSMAKELSALIKALVERASLRCFIPVSTLLPYWTKRLYGDPEGKRHVLAQCQCSHVRFLQCYAGLIY